MADWKIALVVLFGLLLITFGLFTEAGVNAGNLGERVIDVLSKKIPFDFGYTEEGNITLSGTLYLKELDLKTISLEELKVGYEPVYQDSDIFISETKLTTRPYTEIELSGYEGTFLLNETRVKIDGNAEKTSVNGIRFETVKKLIPVKLDSLVYKNIYIKKLDMNRFEIDDALGEIEIQGKVRVELKDEPLKFEGFSGSLNITEEGIMIRGMARHIFISGEDYTASIS